MGALSRPIRNLCQHIGMAWFVERTPARQPLASQFSLHVRYRFWI